HATTNVGTTLLWAVRKSRSCHEMLRCDAAHVVLPGRCSHAQPVDCHPDAHGLLRWVFDLLSCAAAKPKAGRSVGAQACSRRPGATLARGGLAGSCQHATIAMGNDAGAVGKRV